MAEVVVGSVVGVADAVKVVVADVVNVVVDAGVRKKISF